jgi:hypothetical protein
MRDSASQRGKEVGNQPGGEGNASESQKDTKIEGTNSISPFESAKVQKNELKTNWLLRANEPKSKPKSDQKPDYYATSNPTGRQWTEPRKKAP